MTKEEYIEFANALKNNYTIDFGKMDEFCDMAISALSADPCENCKENDGECCRLLFNSAEGEYTKKEPIAKEIKEQEDFWRKKWKDHDSTANFEDAHIAKAVMNAYKYFGLFISDLPTYSFPEREKGTWKMDDGTNAVCPICNKINGARGDFCKWCGADMRGKDNDK